ncbi:hypothetical protein [Streptomyces sp. NPDC056291]|uniref:hypothetical protein n=1 Tax=Streptomyces sp. NPDC056291 TaxID=3345772 RepID=UPI0035E13C80
MHGHPQHGGDLRAYARSGGRRLELTKVGPQRGGRRLRSGGSAEAPQQAQGPGHDRGVAEYGLDRLRDVLLDRAQQVPGLLGRGRTSQVPAVASRFAHTVQQRPEDQQELTSLCGTQQVQVSIGRVTRRHGPERLPGDPVNVQRHSGRDRH